MKLTGTTTFAHPVQMVGRSSKSITSTSIVQPSGETFDAYVIMFPFVAVVGSMGSRGKTTLFNIVGTGFNPTDQQAVDDVIAGRTFNGMALETSDPSKPTPPAKR